MMARRLRRLAAALVVVLAASGMVAVAFWTALGLGSGAGTNGSLAAATISVPATAVNSVTVTWTQQASLVPTSAENSAITYTVERKLGAGAYAAVASGGCSGAKPHGTASCLDAPATGVYSYRVVASYNTWTAISSEAGPVAVTGDSTAPTNAVTLSGVTGGAFKSGASVYYRGTAAGSFTLTNAVSDAGSGPDSSATAALSGTSTGWVHSPSVVRTPAGGPYVSSAFSWSALTTSSPGETVTGSDAAGNTAATALTFTNDSTSPTGGSVDATGLGGTGGRYSTSTALSIAFTPGTDAGAGLATGGAQLLRATASLGDGNCGTYGAYAQVGANDPVSPAANTVPVDHTCYRYRYVVLDRVGNAGTYTSPDIKVDTAAPHPDFLQPITSPETVRAGPAGIATGDIDNDGDQDIVTSNIFESATSVLINNGVGSFRENTVVSNGATIDVGLGKFDSDSNLDLVLLYQGTPPATGLLIIFKGGGDGTFTYLAAANEIVSTGVRSVSLAVGDFNGDVIDDVAVVNSQNNVAIDVGTVMTFLGNPAGTDTFSAATPAQTLSAQIGATDIAFADFNGGAKDLVVTNSASSSITFLAGNGIGFNAPANIAAGAQLAFLDTAYLDAGTNRDIVATVRNSSPSAVRTLFGNGAGGFPTQATTTAGTGATPQAVVAKDFDNDADVDVAVANGSPETVSVLANDGSGAYTIAPASPETGLGGAGALPYGLVSADFNGSGYNDLAVSPVFTSPGELRMLLNQNGTRANLSITQTDSPDPVAAGQSLTYSLTVANAGTGTPSSVKATDRLPAGVTFNAGASSPSCSAAGAAPVTVTCDYGAVAPGSPEALQVVVTTSAATPSSLTNTATVAGNLADATPADNTSTATTTVTDATGPTGGSVDASGLVGTGARYSTSTALSIVLAKGTDPAGLAASGAKLRRSTATLTSGGTANGSCGSYPAATQIGADDPVSPVADTVPAGQACYRYEYDVADTLGNRTTYTSPDIKIDTTAPAAAPSFAFSGLTNTYWSGSTLYYRSDATSGSFTATASASDADSGIASYALPTLPAGWTGTAGALGVRTYSWSAANPTAPVGAQNATATNHATLTSPTAGFTLTSDVTAPATGNVTYTSGYYTSPSVSVTFARGTDGASGVNATSGVLQRASTTLTGVTCGSFVGATFTTVTGGSNPTSPFADSTVASGNCYQYRYLASDNVGNQVIYTSASVAKVDSTPPTITRAVAAKTDGSTPGTIRQGGDYYVYAHVTDNTSVSTVTANTSTFDTGVTAASLASAGGPWTIGGLSYNYRSASLTANTPLTTGTTPSYTITATDAAANTVGPTSYTATIETYNSVITGTAGLVSFWRFGGATTAATDSFGANHGTLVNGALVTQTGALVGDSDKAVRLDGINDYVTIPDNNTLDLGDGPLTLEAWVKRSTVDTNGISIFQKGASAVQFGFYLDNTFLSKDNVGTVASSTVTVTGTAWHHLVVTKSGTTASKLFIDGIDRTGTVTNHTLINTTAALILGAKNGTSEFLAATIDEFAVYNAVLPVATVLDHHKAGSGTG
jgi:uncharacterized repeat protein (TIGR01451 family)